MAIQMDTSLAPQQEQTVKPIGPSQSGLGKLVNSGAGRIGKAILAIWSGGASTAAQVGMGIGAASAIAKPGSAMANLGGAYSAGNSAYSTFANPSSNNAVQGTMGNSSTDYLGTGNNMNASDPNNLSMPQPSYQMSPNDYLASMQRKMSGGQ